VAKTIGREMRTRYLNPQWIEGMKRDNYGGARQMADFAENLWGWQVTVRDAVDADKWEQVFEVYVEDKYGMDLTDFFNQHNPWAYQSMTARMLEAVRKDYWRPDEAVTRKLAAEYALNVVNKGVACCDHTCNNPILNQMVVNIISLPGVLSPDMVEQFKLAVEKMAARSLDEQVHARSDLLDRLNAGPGTTSQAIQQDHGQDHGQDSREVDQKKPDNPETNPDTAPDATHAETVEGYKMEDMNTPDETSDLSSSGIQWAASLFVLLLVGMLFWGGRRKR
jgi:cobaltochelatase CobN